jgi:hypothetical protein
VGTAIFRSSSRSNLLSNRVLVFSFGLGSSLGLLYFVGTEILLVRMFGSQYQQSIRMAQLLGVASLMIGWGDIFNRFLGAHGKGSGLCYVAVSTGTVGIVSAAMMLPKWDIYGAIASSVLAAGTYLGLMIVLYCSSTSRLRGNRASRRQ